MPDALRRGMLIYENEENSFCLPRKHLPLADGGICDEKPSERISP